MLIYLYTHICVWEKKYVLCNTILNYFVHSSVKVVLCMIQVQHMQKRLCFTSYLLWHWFGNYIQSIYIRFYNQLQKVWGDWFQVHIYEWDHWFFTLMLLQLWSNNGAYKTKEGYFSPSKQINNSITDFRVALTFWLFVLWETFPKSHYLFYILPDFYHPICNALVFYPSSDTKV